MNPHIGKIISEQEVSLKDLEELLKLMEREERLRIRHREGDLVCMYKLCIPQARPTMHCIHLVAMSHYVFCYFSWLTTYKWSSLPFLPAMKEWLCTHVTQIHTFLAYCTDAEMSFS